MSRKNATLPYAYLIFARLTTYPTTSHLPFVWCCFILKACSCFVLTDKPTRNVAALCFHFSLGSHRRVCLAFVVSPRPWCSRRLCAWVPCLCAVWSCPSIEHRGWDTNLESAGPWDSQWPPAIPIQDGQVSVDEFKSAVKNACVGKPFDDFPSALKAFISSHFSTVDVNGMINLPAPCPTYVLMPLPAPSPDPTRTLTRAAQEWMLCVSLTVCICLPFPAVTPWLVLSLTPPPARIPL